MKLNINKIHKLKFILVLAILVILYMAITADKVPGVEWSKTFGGADDEFPS